MSVFICSAEPSEIPGHRKCSCCMKDVPLELMAMSTCSDCVIGNFGCQKCYDYGIPVDNFPYKKGKVHRIKEWFIVSAGSGETAALFDIEQHVDEDFDLKDGHWAIAVTCCGIHIDYEQIGQAVAVRKFCKKCWPKGVKNEP